MRKKPLNLFLMTFVGLFVCTFMLRSEVASALPAEGDFDGDGLSDLVVVTVDREANSTAFLIRNSSNPAVPGLYFFNLAGDAYVSGKFFDDRRFFPGIVRVLDLKTPLRWQVKDPQGGDVNLFFGLPGDRIPNQGDLDCDGKTDLIVTRSGTAARYPGFRFWYVALTTGGIIETVFGLDSDRVAVVDMDGDGCHEMLALRSNFTWFTRKLFAQDSTITAQQWGLPGDIPLVPHDINGDGVADHIIVRPGGTGHVAFVRTSDGGSTTVPLGPTGTIPMVGNFFGANTFAWQDRGKNLTNVKTPDGVSFPVSFGASTASSIMRPDGTVITPTDDGRLGGPPPSNFENGGSGGSFSGCDRNVNPNDGRSKGVTYNPENSRNKMKIIMPADYNSGVSSVDVYQGDDHVADCGRATPNEHGNRPRWYCDVTPDDAPKNSTIVFQRNGQTICISIPDPERRYD